MNQKFLIIFSAILTGGFLGIYILSEESKTINYSDSNIEYDPKVQIVNRGEPRVTLKPSFEQIGQLQGLIPGNWERETPSNSMRIAQYLLPGDYGDGELVVFSGIGGSVDANLKRWYNQFKNENGTPVSDDAIISYFYNNDMEITLSFVEGTYSKSSMGMGGPTTEMPGYAMLAAIMLTRSGPYYFKGTGPVQTIKKNKIAFEKFINSIEEL